MYCHVVKPHVARFFCQSSQMRLSDSNQALSAHLNRLLAGQDIARLELAKRMGVADGTLGRIKYGKGNPTIDVVDKIARYFRVHPWELLQPVADVADRVCEPEAEYMTAIPGLQEEIKQLSRGQQQALLSMIREFKGT